MNGSTKKIIEAVLRSDNSVTDEQREAILLFCSRGVTQKPKLVGAREVAEILGCHRKTVYRYVRRGLVRAIHYSPRKVRFDLGEVEAFAASGLPSGKI